MQMTSGRTGGPACRWVEGRIDRLVRTSPRRKMNCLEEFRMCRLWRPKVAFRRYWSAAGAVALLMGIAVSARAAITATGDPEDRYGVTPNVFTVDPFDPMYGGPPVAGHNRGVANTRKLRQTFQNPSDLNVGQINLSFDVTGGSTLGGAGDTGLRLAFLRSRRRARGQLDARQFDQGSRPPAGEHAGWKRSLSSRPYGRRRVRLAAAKCRQRWIRNGDFDAELAFVRW